MTEIDRPREGADPVERVDTPIESEGQGDPVEDAAGSPVTQPAEASNRGQTDPAEDVEGTVELRDLDPETLQRTVELLELSLVRSRRAPLPDPEEMEGFKRVQPDLPDRIVGQWESETDHRHLIERRIVEANITNRSRGQFIGVYLATLIVAAGVVLLLADKDVAGLATLISAVALLVGRFIVHEVRQRADQSDEAPPRGGEIDRPPETS